MQNSIFSLILTEANGNFAIPDLIITDEFATVFSIQNVADISKRKDTLTQNITFPGTKNNNRIFNNLFSFNRESDATLDEVLFSNYSPAVGVRAVLYENNFPIMSGLLSISNIDKDDNEAYTYTGIITGNLVNFFGKLGTTYLGTTTDTSAGVKSLTGFEAIINYDWDTISGTWQYDDNQVCFFPMIDFGNGIVPNPAKFDFRNFRPAIYHRQIIKKMLADYGYTYKSDFIDSDIFKRLYTPFTQKDFGIAIYTPVETFTGGVKPAITMNRYNASTANTGIFIDDYVENDYVSSSVQNVHGINGGWGRSNVLNNRPATIFSFKKQANTGAQITYDFNMYSHAQQTTVEIQVAKIYNYTTPGTPPFTQPVNYPYTYDCNALIADVGISYGSEAYLKTIRVTGNIELPVAEYDKDFTFVVIIQTVTSKGDDLELSQNACKIVFSNPDVSQGSFFTYNFGDTFPLSSALPVDILAKDYLKSIFNIFNLYCVENPEDNTQLIIEPYDTFYSQALNPAPYALDWTKKVDNKKLGISINTALPLAYGFLFASDSDYYNTLYKNTYGVDYGDYTIQNPNGTADELDITPIISATVIVQENNDDKVLPAIYGGEITAKETLKINMRLLYNNGLLPCKAFAVTQTTGDGNNGATYADMVTGLTQYQQSHHILTIDGVAVFNALFGLPDAVYYTVNQSIFSLPNLFNGFYANIISELNDPDIFTVNLNMHLRPADISNLDLRTPIFISTKQGAAYFKVMAVNYYNGNEVSSVTLQKIVYKVLPSVGGTPVTPPPTPPAAITTTIHIENNLATDDNVYLSIDGQNVSGDRGVGSNSTIDIVTSFAGSTKSSLSMIVAFGNKPATAILSYRVNGNQQGTITGDVPNCVILWQNVDLSVTQEIVIILNP